MLKSHSARILRSSLLVIVVATGLVGGAGLVQAADRTVVGELWSADN